MINRTKFLGTIFAFSLLFLGMPLLASAQYRNNDDNYGSNRRNDDNYGNNRRNEINRRALASAVSHVKDDSRSFRRTLDRELDNSRYDERRREDRINDIAKRFAKAAKELENAFDNGGNLRSSRDEAQELLQLAEQIDRFMNKRNSFGSNVRNQWSSIRRDLQTIGNAYNQSYNGGGGRRDRDDDDDNDNNRDRNRGNNNGRGNGNGNRFPF